MVNRPPLVNDLWWHFEGASRSHGSEQELMKLNEMGRCGQPCDTAHDVLIAF